LVVAGVTVVVIVLFFVHPVATALIAACIAFIDFTLLGVMRLWDIPIDAVTFICLAMAVGLSVDYVVHVAHAAFEKGLPVTPEAVKVQIEEALDNTGASVLKGAGSTFLGVLLLSAAPTGVFRIFSKMLCSIVALGCLAGFILLPACLTIFANLAVKVTGRRHDVSVGQTAGS
jgi:predicted RND superfamily exporter protein